MQGAKPTGVATLEGQDELAIKAGRDSNSEVRQSPSVCNPELVGQRDYRSSIVLYCLLIIINHI